MAVATAVPETLKQFRAAIRLGLLLGSRDGCRHGSAGRVANSRDAWFGPDLCGSRPVRLDASPCRRDSIVQAADYRTSRGFTVLTRQDSMRLLERGGVGRIAVPGRPAPTMRPVNFALRDGRIVMRTADPALSAAAAKALAASFEFDEIRNEDHRAWNVIVTGELEALDDEGLDGRGVNAWAPSEGERSIALRIADVSGREVPEPHVPPTSSRLTPFMEVEAATPDTDPDGDGIDPWGRSARARQVIRALSEPAYRYWFRFSFEHLARIPTQGGALLVANHAGVVPIDAALVMHGIERELDRPVYGLHHHGLCCGAGARNAASTGRWGRRPPRQRPAVAARRPPAAARVSRRCQRHQQALPRSIPPRTVRTRRFRRHGDAGGGSRSCRSQSSAQKRRCRSCSGSPVAGR